MPKNYKPTGNTTIICNECTHNPDEEDMWMYPSETSGELVTETDEEDVHEIECQNCGNQGEYVNETTFGARKQCRTDSY